MDFTLPPAIEEARRRARQFVEDEVLPVSGPTNYDTHENITLAALKPLREKAKAAGLWAPQMPTSAAAWSCRPLAWRRFTRK